MNSPFEGHFARISSLLGAGQFAQTQAEIASARAAGADPTRLDYWNAVLTSRQGQHQEAESQLRALTQRAPKNTAIAYELGVCLLFQQRHQEALALFERLLRAKPEHTLSWHQAGQALCALQRFAEAEFAWNKALELAPGRTESALALAHLLEGQGRSAQALSMLQALKQHGPDEYRDITLVQMLLQTGDSEGARRALQDYLTHFPEHPVALHLLAGLQAPDQAPARASDAYVAMVFDAFASDYDQHMQGPLHYQQHQRIAELVQALRPVPAEVLELGCGTGLVGSVLAPLGYTLDGVDLSGQMLQQAQVRGYRQLCQAELTSHLEQLPKASYDLVLAADVLIYFGALEAVVLASFQALRPHGYLLFTVEALTTSPENFSLGQSGRYQHSASYLQAVLTEAGFSSIEVRADQARHELGSPVPGWLVSAQRI